MKKVTIIGLGYIGLPTTLFFAKAGYEVTGVDKNVNIIKKLKNGQITFEEPGLENLFLEVHQKINFVEEPKEADLFIITVPTPFLEDKTIDESYINKAFEDLSLLLKQGDSIVLESTVPPMITEKLIPKIEELGFVVGDDIYLAHVPETIIPGNMVNEFITNKRLIGGYNEKSASVISRYYENVVKGEIIQTDLRTAEFVKIIENTYRDVNIALANELMHIADEMNIDVYNAIGIANKHPRVNIHNPGPGVGGHCISVDPWFLVGLFKEKTNLIKQARDINDNQPHYMYQKLIKNHELSNKKIGIYGLAYKPNIDDFRESPSFEFINILKENGHEYTSYDPWAEDIVESNQKLNFEVFLSDIDLLIVYVAHDHMKENYDSIKEKEIFFAMKI